jgi:hypothetical protein
MCGGGVYVIMLMYVVIVKWYIMTFSGAVVCTWSCE